MENIFLAVYSTLLFTHMPTTPFLSRTPSYYVQTFTSPSYHALFLSPFTPIL